MPAVAPTSTTPLERLGRAQRGPQRKPPAERIAHEHPALPRLGDLAQPALEAVLDVVEHRARIAFRQELRDRPPGVATLHEARDEEHHRSSMIPINRTYAPLQAFVEELYRCGMRHAVTSPGSRNAPLALTLAAQEGVEAVSVLDERSAGFVALGMAKASGRPVAVTCTSGTAAANLHPAVVEAYEARVPLIVLTADRPPELREVGAGQAIDQIKLYGSAAKWFVEVGTHDPGRETAVHHRALACRAYWTAAGGRPGPVHLNFPLREPLAPAPEELDAADWEGRADGSPWTELREHASAPHADDVHAVAERMAAEPRGLIVCGPASERYRRGRGPARGRDGLAAARRADLGRADAATTTAPTWSRTTTCCCASSDFAREHAPGLVLRVGDMPTSKPLRAFVAESSQIVIDPHGAWHEPTRTAELVLQAAAGPTLDALASAVEMRSGGARPRLDRGLAGGGRQGVGRRRGGAR